MGRKINQAGLDLIKSFEQYRDVAYLPTPNDKWTCGFGHTGPEIHEGVTCTPQIAEQWLAQDVAWSETTVSMHAPTYLTENQFSALCSLTYNIGAGNFDTSTLLKDLEAHDPSDASLQFLVWDKQRGETLPGLERRREAEKALFDLSDA